MVKHIEYEYTFSNLDKGNIEFIIENISNNSKLGKPNVSKYSKVGFKEDNVIYRLITSFNSENEEISIYQIKTRIGKFRTLSSTDFTFYSLVSTEEALLNTDLKRVLKEMKKDEDVNEPFVRYDWLNGNISLRHSDKTLYLEFEHSLADSYEDDEMFKFLYEIVRGHSLLNQITLNFGNDLFYRYSKVLRNPIPIQTSHKNTITLTANDFLIRPKTDGVHGILFTLQDGLYIWFKNKFPIKIENTRGIPIHFVIEIELIYNKSNKMTLVYIDLLNEELAARGFVDRYKHAKQMITSKLIKFRSYKVFTDNKKNIIDDFEEFKLTKEYKSINSDGLIVQSTTSYYDANNFVFKYKIGPDNTIDMVLEDDGLKIGKSSFIGSVEKPYEFNGSLWNKYKDEFGYKVVEWQWSVEEGDFIPIRIRNDKLYSNTALTAYSNWDSIFMDINAFFDSKSVKRVAFILNEVKSEMINDESSSFMDLGSGSAGTMNRYPNNSLVIMVEYDKKNIEEAHNRLKKAKKCNILMFESSYLELDTINTIFDTYLKYSKSVQITNFITISHQSRDQIKELHELWLNLLNNENVSEIAILLVDGESIIKMKNLGQLESLGVDIELIDENVSKYRTKIGTTTTSSFEEYLIPFEDYFEDLEEITYDIIDIHEYIKIDISHLNDNELAWLNVHKVVILTIF